eukprot:3892462-Amphidinium_carterae.2
MENGKARLLMNASDISYILLHMGLSAFEQALQAHPTSGHATHPGESATMLLDFMFGLQPRMGLASTGAISTPTTVSWPNPTLYSKPAKLLQIRCATGMSDKHLRL